MAKSSRFTKILKSIFTVIFGCIVCTSVISFTILSIPVYIFRYLLIHRPKSWRPDLEQILDTQSSAMANDYFTTTAPRSQACNLQVIQGHISTEEFQSLVLKNWINATNPETGELSYKRFQQYPERWLGFTFWKTQDKFSIENHVKKLFDKEKSVTDEEIDIELEKLLNRPFPLKQSPWSYHVIENYKKFDSSTNNQNYSIIIITLHHCLTDGYGLLTALIEGLFQDGSLKRKPFSVAKIVPKSSLKRKIYDMVTIPVKAIMEVACILPRIFMATPWLITDQNKKWHQIITRLEPILLQDIKAIKNKFGGSLTSIILTAVSAATYKMLARNGNMNNVKSMLCLSSLPYVGKAKRKTMSNKVTAAIFDLPTSKMLGPVQRLKKVDQILTDNKESALPIAMQYFMILLGSHFYFVCEPLVANRWIQLGITNVPIPIPLQVSGKAIVSSQSVAGGMPGDVGVAIAAVTYGQELSLGISVEAGFFSREELQQFAIFLTQEIKSLHGLTQIGNLVTV